jgi:hypothetical protein
VLEILVGSRFGLPIGSITCALCCYVFSFNLTSKEFLTKTVTTAIRNICTWDVHAHSILIRNKRNDKKSYEASEKKSSATVMRNDEKSVDRKQYYKLLQN